MKLLEGRPSGKVGAPNTPGRSTAHNTTHRSARLVESPSDLAAFTLFVLCVVIPTIALCWVFIIVATS